MLKIFFNKITLVLILPIVLLLVLFNFYTNGSLLNKVFNKDLVKGAATLTSAELARAGLYDVTAPEFGADPTGQTDSTAAIQRAIDRAYNSNRKGDPTRGAVFFPEGEYLISRTLVGFQRRDFARTNAVLLIGSTKGAKPKIILKANSFNDGNASNDSRMERKQAMLHIWTCSGKGESEAGLSGCDPSYENQRGLLNQVAGNAAMQMSGGVRNLEFVIKSGNPDAIGVRFNGAQENILSNVKVTIEDTAFAGISGLIGTNAVFQDIEVIGGKIGIYGDDFPRWPSLNNIRLIDQTMAAIGGVRSGGPVSINGFEIIKDEAPAISDAVSGFSYGAESHGGGAYALSDGVIKFRNASNNAAIENNGNRQITMQNVYFEKASVITRNPSDNVLGNANGWSRVDLYANVFPTNAAGRGVNLVNGTISYEDTDDITPNVSAPNVASLLARHGVPRGTLPSPDVIMERSKAGDPAYVNLLDKNIVPLATDSNLTDSSPDHTARIKEVLSDSRVRYVFVPKGVFLVSDTLDLGRDVKLIGVSNFLSEIQTHPSWRTGANTATVIRTANDPNATTAIAFLKLTYETDPSKATFNMLHWRSGQNSVLYNITYRVRSSAGYLNRLRPRNETWVTDNGGGRWYGANNAGAGLGTRWYPGYRSIMVENTTQPFTIYGLDPEDAGYSCTAQTREACRPDPRSMQVEIRNARNVAIRGFKCEDYNSVNVFNSTNFFANGFGGCTDWYFENVDKSLVLNGAAKKAKEDAGKDLLVEKNGATTVGVKRRDGLAVYQRGTLPDFTVWNLDAEDDTPDPVCGNGNRETGEACDLGQSNGACPSTCSSTCTVNTCDPDEDTTNWIITGNKAGQTSLTAPAQAGGAYVATITRYPNGPVYVKRPLSFYNLTQGRTYTFTVPIRASVIPTQISYVITDQGLFSGVTPYWQSRSLATRVTAKDYKFTFTAPAITPQTVIALKIEGTRPTVVRFRDFVMTEVR